MTNAMEKVDVSVSPEKVSSGVACLDDLMGGGLEPEIITELFGEGGSGKSNLCMQFCLATLRSGRSVIYLDSEGFSTERFKQMSGGDDSLTKNLYLYRLGSLEDQDLAIMRLPKIAEKIRAPGLIVIDSFTEFFRLENQSDLSARSAGFQKQLSNLSAAALKLKVPALITNQIYQDPDSGRLNPFGGFLVDHNMKAIYRVEKFPNGKRRISVTKHRSLPEGRSSEFRITDFGLSCEVQ